MITTTSEPPADEIRADGDAPVGRAPRGPSRTAKALLLALVACVTVAVLALAGVFDSSSSSDINIDPVTTNPSGAQSNVAARPGDPKVAKKYLADLKSWTECYKAHAGETSTPCGQIPTQPDDPVLNLYLGKVLDWNKCAGPALKRGATAEAEKACGPQPTPPA